MSKFSWILASAGLAVAALAAFGVMLLFRYQPMATQRYPGSCSSGIGSAAGYA